MPSQKIMFVIGTLEVGGSERHLASVASALVARGWCVAVFTLAGGGPLANQLLEQGVEVLGPPPRKGGRVSLARRIINLAIVSCCLFTTMVRRRPTVVHCFLPAAYAIGAPLSLLSLCPIRVMSRRSLNRYQHTRRIFGVLERLLHLSMTAILANSRRIAEELRGEGVVERRLGLIYNGVSSTFAPDSSARMRMRSELSISDGAVVLIIVANLIPYKGHRDLLDAVALSNREMPNGWRLLIVGRDDGCGEQLKQQAARLGLTDSVMFLGSRNDVPELYAAADIGILCSHEEGFSNAILEGMASRLPMVVTDVGGNAEAVLNDETGVVVPAHDPERLASAIVRLAKNLELRQQFGAAAQKRVWAAFSFDHAVDCYEALYRGLLAGKTPEEIDAIRPS